MMKKIVFMGFGKRASTIVEDYLSEGLLGNAVEVAGIYDLDTTGPKRYLEHLGINVEIFSSPGEMIEKTNPDGIMITSQEHAHLKNFKQIHQYNIPLFVEKPLTSNIEEAVEFFELAKNYKASILSGHNMRFAPILKRAKQLLKQGTIGRINTFRFHNDVPYGSSYFRCWQRTKDHIGAGIVEKGCHDLDIIHMLTGSRAVKIFCKSSCSEYGGDKSNDLLCSECPEEITCKDSWKNFWKNIMGQPSPEKAKIIPRKCVYAEEIDIEDEDICLVTLENGSYGVYAQNFYAPRSYTKRLYTLIGGEGFMEIDLNEDNGTIKIFPRYKGDKEIICESFEFYGRNHYNGDNLMIIHFLDVISGKVEPEVTIVDGYHAMATAFSADISSLQGKEVNISIKN
jgi:predicted dehydrogenase